MYILSIVTITTGVCFLAYFAVILCYAGPSASAAWIWAASGLFLLGTGVLARRCAVSGEWHHKGIWITAFAAAAAFLAIFCFFALKVGGGMAARPEENLEYLVVLGAQVKGDRPSRALKKRLDTALDYGNTHPDVRFVLSGGQGTGEDISEAECMYRYLKDCGIPDERLLLEDTSTTTLENLKNSDALYDLKNRRVGIVTNNFHIARSLMLAGQSGYTRVSGIPAPIETVMLPHYFVREVIAIAYYTFKRM